MEVDEITILSADFPGGLTFGPVTFESALDVASDARDELPVTVTPRRYFAFGIRWYVERYRTRGVFSVVRDRIRFRPTAPVLTERARWWRRAGCRLFAYWTPRAQVARESTALDR